MGDRIARIKKDKPAVADLPEVKSVAADIDQYASIDAFSSSEAGGIFKAAMLTDVANSVQTLIGSYKTATLTEIVAICARLEARVSLLQSLNRARTNLELAEQALKELTE